MTDAVSVFVATQNINHFRTLLQKETNSDARSMLLDLLANELAKLPEAQKRVELMKTARILIT